MDNRTSSAVIFEEKIKDLESKLSHSYQSLKAKEHVLHLQQDQIKKLEDMYKRSLKETANVTCEHKKTLNDLENLRIILKSYENRHVSQEDFECQVDLITIIPPPFEFADECEKDDQLIKINEFLEKQSKKTDKIMDLLQSTNSNKMQVLNQYIEDLQIVTQCLTEITEQRTFTTTKSILFPILEEKESTNSAHYKLIDYDTNNGTVSIQMECSSQTETMKVDSSFNTNMPEEIWSQMTQTSIVTIDSFTTIDVETSEMGVVCDEAYLSSSVSVLVQNTFHDEIINVKKSLEELESQQIIRESLFETFQETFSGFQCLLERMAENEREIKELHSTIACLKTIIERKSILTTEEVKQLCKEITVKTVENYSEVLTEMRTLTEENEMLRIENENLKRDSSEVPRMFVELTNSHAQTYYYSDYKDKFQQIDNEGGRRKDEFSRYLEEALSGIKYLEDKMKYLEDNNIALEELKHICLVVNPASVQSQVEQLKVMYERKIMQLESQLDKAAKPKCQESIGSQTYEWTSMNEQLENLRHENEDLLAIIQNLKQELNVEKINRNAMDELKVMCLKLGQNLNETSAIKEENVLLQEQLDDIKQSSHAEMENVQRECLKCINNAREEIQKLRLENKDLHEGIDELKLVVFLDNRLEDLDKKRKQVPYQDASTSNPSSNVSSLETFDTISDNKHGTVTIHNYKCDYNEMDTLKHKFKDLSKKLQAKKVNSQFGLLSNLEQDLNILMREFSEFKKASLEEVQRFVKDNSELNNKNNQLVSCINQYKNVNESLLKSHYELEQARNIAALEHQNLIEQYLKLQDKIQNFESIRKPGIDKFTITFISGKDLQEVEYWKTDYGKLQSHNATLKQEVENLIMQINEQHFFCLENLKQNLGSKSCNTCETSMKTLDTLNQNFKELNDENLKLKQTLREKEIQLNELIKKYKNLTKDILDYNKIKEQLNDATSELSNLEADNKQLKHEVRLRQEEIQNLKSDKKAIKEQFEKVNHQLRECLKEIDDKQIKITEKNEEINKYQEELSSIHNAMPEYSYKDEYLKLESEYNAILEELSKKDTLINWNESRVNKLKQVEEQLKEVTNSKDKVEMDFESYIRTNNLLQQTMTTHNESLVEEIKQLKVDNDMLRKQLFEAKCFQESSNQDVQRIVDECKFYKVQLEKMSRTIEQHMKEHQIYKAEVEDAKKNLLQEISTLKQMLDMQHMRLEAFDLNKFDGSDIKKQTYDLNMFINAKELEIDYLMEQRTQAIDTMNKLVYNSHDPSKESQGSFRSKGSKSSYYESTAGESKKKLIVKKAVIDFRSNIKDSMASSSRTKPVQRSSSLPRPVRHSKFKSSATTKDKRMSEPVASKSFHCRKPFSTMEVKKKS